MKKSLPKTLNVCWAVWFVWMILIELHKYVDPVLGLQSELVILTVYGTYAGIFIFLNRYITKAYEQKNFSSYTRYFLSLILILISLGSAIYSIIILDYDVKHISLFCNSPTCPTIYPVQPGIFNLFIGIFTLLQLIYLSRFAFQFFKKNDFFGYMAGIVSIKQYFLLILTGLLSPFIMALTVFIAIASAIGRIHDSDELGGYLSFFAGLRYSILTYILFSSVVWVLIHRKYVKFFSQKQRVGIKILYVMLFVVNALLLGLYFLLQ